MTAKFAEGPETALVARKDMGGVDRHHTPVERPLPLLQQGVACTPQRRRLGGAQAQITGPLGQ